MNTAIVLIVGLFAVSAVLGHPLPKQQRQKQAGPWWKGKFNNGFRDISEKSTVLLETLKSDASLTGCGSVEIEKVWTKRDLVYAQVNCDGATKWASLNVQWMEAGPDMTALPEAGADWELTDCQRIIQSWFKGAEDAKNCDIDIDTCLETTSKTATKQFVCPVDCDGTITYKVYNKKDDIVESDITLNSVQDELDSGCVKKLTKSHLDHLLFDSSRNTMTFLREVGGMQGDLSTTGKSTYVAVRGGIQHLIEVQGQDSSGAVITKSIAIFDPIIDGVELDPYSVAQPFDNWAYGIGFLTLIQKNFA